MLHGLGHLMDLKTKSKKFFTHERGNCFIYFLLYKILLSSRYLRSFVQRELQSTPEKNITFLEATSEVLDKWHY